MHIMHMELTTRKRRVGNSATLKVWEKDTFAPQMNFHIDAFGAKLGTGAEQERVESDVPAHFIGFGLKSDLIDAGDADVALELLKRAENTDRWSWEAES